MAEVEINEMFRFYKRQYIPRCMDSHVKPTMSDEAAKVPAHYAMPCCALFGIELL